MLVLVTNVTVPPQQMLIVLFCKSFVIFSILVTNARSNQYSTMHW